MLSTEAGLSTVSNTYVEAIPADSAAVFSEITVVNGGDEIAILCLGSGHDIGYVYGPSQRIFTFNPPARNINGIGFRRIAGGSNATDIRIDARMNT